MSDFRHSIKGMMLALFGFSLFSIGDVFAKFIADSGYTPVQVGFWVSLFALIGFVSISPEMGGLKSTLKTKKLKLHLLRGVLSMAIFICVVNGFKQLGMAMTYTLLFAGPFVTAVLSVLILKERFGAHRWISIIFGFIGVVVVLRPGAAPFDMAAIGMLIAACCHAGSSIIIRKIGKDDPVIAFAFYNSIISLILFGCINFYQGGFDTLPSIADLTFFASVMFFHIGGTFSVTRAFSSTETALVAPMHYVQLLWGVVFGYILFETAIDLWTMVGAGIIVLSGVYMIWREQVRHSTLSRGVVTQGVIHWRAIARERIKNKVKQRRKGK